jgi:hypothetical protein
MKFWNGMGAAVAAIGLSLAAAGQTCTTAPTSVTTLNIERTLTLANLLTTIAPNADPATLAAVAGGALEIREVLIYNPGTSNLTSTLFLVPTGTPSPTPAGGITAANTVMVTITTVSQILASCTPSPSLIFTGTVTGSIGALLAPSLIGAVESIALGYTTDSPAKINNVTATIAGVVTAYSAAATGTLVVPGVTTPIKPGAGDIVLKVLVDNDTASPITTNTVVQVSTIDISLDASTLTTGGTAPLTFTWSGNQGVVFVGGSTGPIVALQIPNPGDYPVTVTAVDSAVPPHTATLTFVLEFLGKPK